MFKPVLKNLAKLMPLLAAFLFVQIQACKDKDEVKKMYSITYDLNGGTGSLPSPQNYEIGGAGVNLANGTGLAQKGFAFGGWSEVKNGTAVTSPYTPKSNVILYAIWIPVYTITYDLNKGTGAPPPEVAYLKGKEGITLDAGAALSRDNFTFAGWSESPDGNPPLTSPYTPTANVTLYAIWQPLTYTVTFDLNYGAGSTAPTPPMSLTYTAGGDGIPLPVVPIRAGYSFQGWATSTTGTTAIPSPYKPTANVTLYAIWQAGTGFTVTFDLNYGAGSTAPPPPMLQIYTTGDGIPLPVVPIRAGYSFQGWATSATGTTALPSPYKPTADVTLYAIWQAGFTVTFDLNYGAGSTAPTPPPMSLTYTAGGDGIPLPIVPIRAGYSFQGWATSTTETTAVPSPYKPTADVTLYAIWQAGTGFTVTFDLNYGAGSTAPTPPMPQIYTAGDGLTLPTGADVTRSGYTLTGWATAATETTALPSPYKPTADVTLYAIWQAGTGFTVTFDLNYGAGSTAPTPPMPQIYTAGDGLTLPTGADVTRAGYTLTGWAAAATETTALPSPYKPTANVTLYAIWQAGFTVAFDLNYGAGSTAPTPPTPQIYTAGDGLALPTGADVTRSGFTLTGWATSATETTAIPSPYKPTTNVTLYAIWQPLTYTVTFDLNYGAGSTAPTPPTQQTYTTGDGLTLPTSADVTRSGFTLTGWATSATETTTLPSPYKPAANVTLYAIWQAANTGFTVTFDLNYGAGSTAPTPPPQQTYTTGDGLTLPVVPIRAGYSFQGWATSATETTTLPSPYKPAANVTLYAIWQPFILTSTSYSNGGTIPRKYADLGGSTSPQFSWTGAPPPSSFAKFIIVFYDATARMWHFRRAIDKDVSSLAEGGIPIKAAPDYLLDSYSAPAPGSLAHTYEFKLYAVKEGYSIDDFTKMENHETVQADWAALEAANAAYIVSQSAIYSGTYADN